MLGLRLAMKIKRKVVANQNQQSTTSNEDMVGTGGTVTVSHSELNTQKETLQGLWDFSTVCPVRHRLEKNQIFFFLKHSRHKM